MEREVRFEDLQKQRRQRIISDSINNDLKEFFQRHKNELEDEMYSIICIHTIKNKGISHQDLADSMHMDRKSIRPYKKRLIENGLIIENKNGLITSRYDTVHPILNAEVIAQSFIYLLFEKHRPLVINEEKFTNLYDKGINKEVDADFTTYKKLFNSNFSDNSINERKLFEFSNQVGAFITYSIINALNPDNHDPGSSSQVTTAIIKKMISNSVNKILPVLIKNFQDIFIESNNIKKISDNSLASYENDPNDTFNELQRTEIYNAFTNLYPLITYEFEKWVDKRYSFRDLLKNIPPREEYYYDIYLESIKRKQRVTKEQKACLHDFKPPIKTNTGIFIIQCSKCKFIKYKRNHPLFPK